MAMSLIAEPFWCAGAGDFWSGRGAGGRGAAAQARVLQGWGLVGLVEGADVGAGRDDLVDAVEDVVGEGDVQAGEQAVEVGPWCGRREVRW
jgi:hypothetical protein